MGRKIASLFGAFLMAFSIHGQSQVSKYKRHSTFRQLFSPKQKEQAQIQAAPLAGTTAFFCKLEEKRDKKGKTKLRFRLGDQATVDRYEGKN